MSTIETTLWIRPQSVFTAQGSRRTMVALVDDGIDQFLFRVQALDVSDGAIKTELRADVSGIGVTFMGYIGIRLKIIEYQGIGIKQG